MRATDRVRATVGASYGPGRCQSRVAPSDAGGVLRGGGIGVGVGEGRNRAGEVGTLGRRESRSGCGDWLFQWRCKASADLNDAVVGGHRIISEQSAVLGEVQAPVRSNLGQIAAEATAGKR